MVKTDLIDKMTVGQLIALLQEYDPNMQVAMAKDEEGNGFSGEIEPANTGGMCVLWPGYMGEIDELSDYKPDEDDFDEFDI